MIKKGYTLIEILVAMAITVTLLSIASAGINNYYVLKNKLETENFNNSILNMFNYARLDCKYKECEGQIRALPGEDEISFYESLGSASALIRRLQVPKGFCITQNDVKSGDGLICVDRNGVISSACSIWYKDRIKKPHIITVGAGSFYVDIKG